MEHAGLKLFIDESLPPDFALWLNDTGNYDAIHPLHVGRYGEPDHKVLARCLEKAGTIVTQNARDFRKLATP
jgi:predicted nuclease of predicted toxin-antitoxin system